MSIHHDINDDSKVILTTVMGAATDIEFIHAIKKYQNDYKGKAKYFRYSEIVDFSDVTNMEITMKGIMTLSTIAPGSDQTGEKTKLALIVSSNLGYGLARMYTAYRSCQPKANKEVRVFINREEACAWIDGT